MSVAHNEPNPDQVVSDLMEAKQALEAAKARVQELEHLVLSAVEEQTKLGSDRTVKYGSFKVKVSRPLNIRVDKHELAEVEKEMAPSDRELFDALFKPRVSVDVSKRVLDWVKESRQDFLFLIADAITEKPGAVRVEVLL